MFYVVVVLPSQIPGHWLAYYYSVLISHLYGVFYYKTSDRVIMF